LLAETIGRANATITTRLIYISVRRSNFATKRCIARLSRMSPPAPINSATNSGMRQMARMPRDSDGVGSALRQIFNGAAGLPSDFKTLLGRLDKND